MSAEAGVATSTAHWQWQLPLAQIHDRHHNLFNMEQKVIYDRKPAVLKLAAGDYWWCSCGKSQTQPYCDGSHKGSGMGPVKFTLAEEKTVALCNCKHSANPPYCDGSHSKLPQ